MSAQQFETVIQKSGARAWIELPFDPNQVWGVKQRHYVTGSVNGCAVRGALELAGERYVLSLGAVWRRDNGLDGGAQVAVTLLPEGPQAETMPADISAALEASPAAKAFFQSLATFYRRNYMRWIEGARRPETRRQRIAEMIQRLEAGQRE
jgi:hypothetical protein